MLTSEPPVGPAAQAWMLQVATRRCLAAAPCLLMGCSTCCCLRHHCLGCLPLLHLLLLLCIALVGCQGRAAPGSWQLGCGPGGRMTLTARQQLQVKAPAAANHTQIEEREHNRNQIVVGL